MKWSGWGCVWKDKNEKGGGGGEGKKGDGWVDWVGRDNNIIKIM